MPLFDQKKVSEDIFIWLAVIGLITLIFFVAKALIRTPPLLVAVSLVTPIVGFVWSKYNVALFDNYEMKNVAVAAFMVSIACSMFIGLNNGKVESYLGNLFLEGKTVQYEEFVDAQEIYDGRKTIPPHYETAYRFEPTNKGHWAIKAIEYAVIFICFGIPVINYQILAYANKKADTMKRDTEYKRKRKAFILSKLQ